MLFNSINHIFVLTRQSFFFLLKIHNIHTSYHTKPNNIQTASSRSRWRSIIGTTYWVNRWRHREKTNWSWFIISLGLTMENNNCYWFYSEVWCNNEYEKVYGGGGRRRWRMTLDVIFIFLPPPIINKNECDQSKRRKNIA